ncbi:MAG: carbohydrate-binding domain-containing protein [Lachnospiraceae bacterium]|nr:carbohydrate-binding domain-containing protein [Lachnospiraceae bacterium]
MSTHKRIDSICIAAVLLAVVLTVLLINGRALGIVPVMSAEVSDGMFTAKDMDADWNVSTATRIVLSDQGTTIDGNGAYVYDGNVCIAYAGTYVLTGELTDGSVVIDAEKSDDIWISLEDVTLHCDDDAAIRIEQADKVFLTLAEGTKSTISSGEQYNEESVASGTDGAIYSRDDLTINGTGELVIDTAYRHGIVCNDDLVIAGGNITINAAEDGIHANDSVRIRDAAISIAAGDDGITVSNEEETSYIYVASGSISISECYEGLEAIDITIAGGNIDIAPTDDGINANGYGENSVIRITGGDVTIINPSGRDADGLDSNGDIYIEGGRTFISVTDGGSNCALDYGSENGGECIVSGGTVIACGGSAMAEGFDADSPQGFLMHSAKGAAGTTIRLADAQGRELLSEEIPCSFSSAVISTPTLKVGDICTIEVGGAQEQVTIDNSSEGGFMAMGMRGGGMRGGRGQDNRKPFDKPEMSDDESRSEKFNMWGNDENRPGRQEMPGNGERPFEPGEVQGQGSTLILLGISIMVLLSGLFMAMKIKY